MLTIVVRIGTLGTHKRIDKEKRVEGPHTLLMRRTGTNSLQTGSLNRSVYFLFIFLVQ